MIEKQSDPIGIIESLNEIDLISASESSPPPTFPEPATDPWEEQE